MECIILCFWNYHAASMVHVMCASGHSYDQFNNSYAGEPSSPSRGGTPQAKNNKGKGKSGKGKEKAGELSTFFCRGDTN